MIWGYHYFWKHPYLHIGESRDRTVHWRRNWCFSCRRVASVRGCGPNAEPKNVKYFLRNRKLRGKGPGLVNKPKGTISDFEALEQTLPMLMACASSQRHWSRATFAALFATKHSSETCWISFWLSAKSFTLLCVIFLQLQHPSPHPSLSLKLCVSTRSTRLIRCSLISLLHLKNAMF